MKINVSSNPPLGFVTTFDGPQITFAIGADLDTTAAEDWEFSIWHNNDSQGNWTGLPLTLLNKISHTESSFFQGRLARADDRITSFEFTLRFRRRGGSWKWVQDEFGLENGTVVFKPSTKPNHDIGFYLSDLDTGFGVNPLESQHQSCVCWEISRTVPPAHGSHSGWDQATIGTLTTALRWFALVRHNEHWFSPRQGRDLLKLDRDALLLSFHCADGQHLALVAVSGFDDITCVFKADEEGRVVMVSRNEREVTGAARTFVAVGQTWHSAVEAAMTATKRFVNRQIAQEEQISGSRIRAAPEEGQNLESWYDGLTYCTWNGLGQHLTPAKILDSLDVLKKNEIDVTNLIIDDNWQSLDYSGFDNFYHRWTDFEANTENFPGGLKNLISNIRNQHPGIADIAVWHGIFGYWGGMSPDGKVSREYSMRTFKRQEGIFLGGGTMTTVDGADVGRLYDDFYSFLVDSGVTAVKTDTQSFLDYPQDADDRRNLTLPYQNAWRAAMLKHFSSKSIACMAQIPQTVFYTMMRSDMPKILMRNSDDFFPDDPSSHTWHVFCNAHSAVLAEHLNVLPDWDMFQTDHAYSSFHAAARCLSGGPIYITDIPGRHDVPLIHQMTAKNLKGRSIILRPEKLGRSSEIYVGHAEARLLRVETTHQGASILGLFNVGSSTSREIISLAEFPDLVDGTRYITRHYISGTYSGPWSKQDDFPLVEVEVAQRGFEILTAYPVHTFGTTDIAVLGLLGKMSGAAAIRSLSYHQEHDVSAQVEIRVVLKALGLLGIYHSNEGIGVGNLQFNIHGTDLTGSSHVEATRNTLIFDVTSAWAEFRELVTEKDIAGKELECCIRVTLV